MKTKNNNNEVVTRGMLQETFKEFSKSFGEKFGTQFLAKLEVLINAKIDTKIDALAVMMQEGFMSLAERMDTFQQNHGVIRTDVVDLNIRVTKLEKKAK